MAFLGFNNLHPFRLILLERLDTWYGYLLEQTTLQDDLG
jgi:hypothetical protein